MANVHPQLQAYKDREKNLTDKIKRMKAGEISAEMTEGDGRQDEAIARNEALLREVKTAIADFEKNQPADKPK